MKQLKCKSCKGKKKVMRLGMQEKQCEACAGTGYIKSQVDSTLKQQDEPVSKKGKTKD